MGESATTEKEREIREWMDEKILADAITVDVAEDETTVSLFYHKPERSEMTIFNVLGIDSPVPEPDPEMLVADMMDDVSSVVQPERMDVEDKTGYYIIELTFEPDYDPA